MPQWLQKISPVLLRPEFTENPEKPCRLIVEMATPYSDKVASYIEASEGRVHREMRLFPAVIVEVPYSALQPMILSPHVRKIWHDVRVRALLDIAVPAVGGSKVQDLGFTGKDVTVAVIDTGIFPHPDLIYPQSRIVGWHDLVNERSIPYDDNGHGTHVSGIIAGNGVASRGKYRGMAPEAQLVGIKALDRDGEGNSSDVISALEWCIENQKTYNIKVINMSLGSAAQDSAREDPLCRVVSAAWSRGMVVCIAAGNDGPDPRTINSPGITPNAITVGNLNDKETVEPDDDVLSDSSSRGPTIDGIIKPDILAPGTNITSLRVGGGYRSLSGTSMATPMVTGAAAQIYQKWPDLKPDQVKMLLRRNARSMGMQSFAAGSGALNVDGVFDEPQKDGRKQNSLLNLLFGNNSLFSKFQKGKQVADNKTKKVSLLQKLFRKKQPVADTSNEKTKTNDFNPLALALLAMIPLAMG
ncbi:MAG: S8 family peptidase [Bacillota bacterium]